MCLNLEISYENKRENHTYFNANDNMLTCYFSRLFNRVYCKEDIMELKQVAKSKTVNFNIWMPLILAILPQIGVLVTPELAGAILGIGNIILRFFTKGAVAEK